MIGSKLKALTVFSIYITLFFSGCNKPDKGDTQIHRFEADLVAALSDSSKQNIDGLKIDYPQFLPIFTEHIIRIGKVNDPNLNQLLGQFTGDPVIQDLSDRINEVYANFSLYSDQISASIKEFQQKVNLEPSISIITFISGFNQSFVTLPGMLGIGIDNYLGSDTPYYKQLRLPQYIIDRMSPEYLAADAIRAWIKSELESRPLPESLLDQMIYDGIVMYSAEQILPKKEQLNIMQYSDEQRDWCQSNEKVMWKFLIEKEYIYSTDALLIRRLTGEAPFSRDLGNDSSPRAASWIGYQIVKKMMSRGKASLHDLVYTLTPKEILSLSAYRP